MRKIYCHLQRGGLFFSEAAAQLAIFFISPQGFCYLAHTDYWLHPFFFFLSLSVYVCVLITPLLCFLQCANEINWIEEVAAFIWIRLSAYFTEEAGGLNSLCLPHETENSSWQQPPVARPDASTNTTNSVRRWETCEGSSFDRCCSVLCSSCETSRCEEKKKWLSTFISPPSWYEPTSSKLRVNEEANLRLKSACRAQWRLTTLAEESRGLSKLLQAIKYSSYQ